MSSADKQDRDAALVTATVRMHQALLEALGLNVPSVRFVRGLRGHLARYVSGSGRSPIIVIDPGAVRRGARAYNVALPVAFETTLLHEYGHAYLEMIGVRSADPDAEEHVVEHFARTYAASSDAERAMQILDDYADGCRW